MIAAEGEKVSMTWHIEPLYSFDEALWILVPGHTQIYFSRMSLRHIRGTKISCPRDDNKGAHRPFSQNSREGLIPVRFQTVKMTSDQKQH